MSTEPPPVLPSGKSLNWFWVLGLLTGPAALTALTSILDRSSSSPAPVVAMVGGLVGGVGSGILLGLRFGKTNGLKVVLSVVLGAVCVVASVTMAMFGCLAAGYQLNFH